MTSYRSNKQLRFDREAAPGMVRTTIQSSVPSFLGYISIPDNGCASDLGLVDDLPDAAVSSSRVSGMSREHRFFAATVAQHLEIEDEFLDESSRALARG